MASEPVLVHRTIPEEELQHRLLGYLRLLLLQIEPGPDQPPPYHERALQQDDRRRLDQ